MLSSSQKVHYGKTNPTAAATKKPKQKVKKNDSTLLKYILGLFSVVVVISLGYYIGNMYTHVEVSVVPRIIKFDDQHKAPAFEVASINIQNQSDGQSIPIVPVNFEYTADRTVENLQTEFVSTKSTGQVNVINTGATTQLLTEGTRFINPQTQKIYFLVGPRIILKGGTPTAPSSVMVTIEAAEPGEEYDMKSGTLQIFAWYDKKDPRNQTQHAQVLSGIEGGFVGDKPLIDQESEDKVVNELKKELQFVLREKAASLSLGGAFKIDSPESLSFDEPRINTLLKVPKISLRGTYQVYLMKKNDWYQYVKSNSNMPPESIKSVAIAPLTESKDSFPEFTITMIEDQKYITQVRHTIFFMQPHEPNIRKKLYGVSIDDLPQVLKDYDLNISNVSVEVQPFWLQTMPTDDSKISIVVK